MSVKNYPYEVCQDIDLSRSLSRSSSTTIQQDLETSLDLTSSVCSSDEDDEDDEGADEALYQEFRSRGPVLADHSELTKKHLAAEEKQWKKFCQRRKLTDPDKALVKCDVPLFKLYLEKRLQNSNVKKLSAIQDYWGRLSMNYAQSSKAKMSESILYDIGNWLKVYLAPKYHLNTSKKEKAGISIDTLSLLLTHHWVDDERIFQHERLRIQHAATLILAGATSTRPGTLIGALLYRHLEFQIFPPIEGESRSQLALIVRLEHVKRTAGHREPKIFAFREDDMLIYDPLVLFQALALADSAFRNNIRSPENFYSLKVPSNTDRLRLLWKDEWLDRPVFRDVEKIGDDLVISTDKPISYHKERTNLTQLGRSFGLEKALEWYDLRRGSGKQLNAALTPEERNKIMGHRKGDSSTYLTYYMSDFIDTDCQSICFGSAPRRDVIRLATQLRYHRDAPKSLTTKQLADIETDEILSTYLKKRSSAIEEWKQEGYRNQKDAAGTKMEKQYNKFNKKANSRRRKLKDELLQSAIKEFHKTVHIEEVDRQLEGTKPVTEIIAPSEKVYDIPERSHVAFLFSKLADIRERRSIDCLRIDLIKTFTALAHRRENPVKLATKRGLKSFASKQTKSARRHKEDSSTSEVKLLAPHFWETPASLDRNSGHNCSFCQSRGFQSGFHRIDSLARHMRGHLKEISGPFSCPWGGCSSFLADSEHFAEHTDRVHGLKLPPQVLRK